MEVVWEAGKDRERRIAVVVLLVFRLCLCGAYSPRWFRGRQRYNKRCRNWRKPAAAVSLRLEHIGWCFHFAASAASASAAAGAT